MSFQANPKDRWDSYTKELSLGLTDHVALRQREHPEEDAATAEAAVLASISKRNKFSNLLAQHNLPGDASQDSNNLAQLQGRLGGMARPNPDGNDPTATVRPPRTRRPNHQTRRLRQRSVRRRP
jgi:hypothetical protein